MYGIVLIAVLVATGGIIAFIGDRLGTKIGKKRLSLFGLRPRYTSTIVTIFTGFLITATTLGIMSVISRDVRTALFGMEQLNKDLQTSRENLYLVSNSLEKVQAELENSRQEVSSLQLEQQSLIEKNSELSDENTSLAEKNSELSDENISLAEKNSELSEQNLSLTEKNSSLSEQNSELSDENISLSEKNSALLGMNSDLADKNSELSKENSSLIDQNSDLERQKIDLQTGLVSMREGNIAYNAGEILASGTIAGGASESEFADKIKSMAQDLQVWIYQPDFDKANEIVSNSKTDMIVRLIAAGNLIRGEPVRADIEIYPNKKVFNAGELITSKIFEINSSDEVESIVMNFLREDVNEVAQTRGILKDPIRNSVGIIEGKQFYDVVGELQKIRGRVRISAYARDDTDALGPLRLNFLIEEVL